MEEKLKSGQKTPVSGQYKVIGPRGGNKGREVTSTKGNTLPPSKPGERYILVDKTLHKKK